MPQNFCVEKLRENRIFTFYQHQLGKNTEKTEKEGVVKEMIHIGEEWKQIKAVLVEAAVQTVGYQPKPDETLFLSRTQHRESGLIEQLDLKHQNVTDFREEPTQHIKTRKG